jgi:Ser/Thr protein kinase RdoA (MazF antagonist)
VAILDCQVANRQPGYQALLLNLQQPALQVVVKLAGPQAAMPSSFARTAYLHRLVAEQTDIPMPETLAVDTSCQRWPWRYFIRTYLPGQEWAVVRPQLDPQALSVACRQIGRAVAQLHRLHFRGFGELTEEGDLLGDGDYLPALADHARRIIRPAPLQELFLSLLARERSRFGSLSQACLCHEDLHQHNLLFERHAAGWRLLTILDFDKAWAGHAESDLARMDLWKMTGPAFWQAYREVCPLADDYPERRPFYQLLWCLEYARSTPEHLADTQRLCASLGLPRLESFDPPRFEQRTGGALCGGKLGP